MYREINTSYNKMTKSSHVKSGYKTTTIDLIHKKKMKEFQKEERNLPKMKRRVKELSSLLDTFEMLNRMGKYSNIETNTITSILPKKRQHKGKTRSKGKTAMKKQAKEQQLKNFDEYYVCLDEKDKIEAKISELENNTKKQEYFMEVGDLLFQYYDDEKNREIAKSSSSQITKKSKKKNSILNYFARKRKEQKRKKAEAEAKRNQENQLINTSNSSILVSDNSANNEEKQNKEMFKGNMRYIGKNNVITRYMRTVDPDYIVPLEHDEQHDYCQDCECYMKTIHSEGVMRCELCGYQEHILIDSDKPSYKDPPRELSYYNYLRVNHLIELIIKCIHFRGSKQGATCFISSIIIQDK